MVWQIFLKELCETDQSFKLFLMSLVFEFFWETHWFFILFCWHSFWCYYDCQNLYRLRSSPIFFGESLRPDLWIHVKIFSSIGTSSSKFLTALLMPSKNWVRNSGARHGSKYCCKKELNPITDLLNPWAKHLQAYVRELQLKWVDKLSAICTQW